MSDLGPRKSEPPVGSSADSLAQWAASEVSAHEQICGERYKRIDEALGRVDAKMASNNEQVNARIKAIEDKIGGAIKWVMGIVAALGVALFMQARQATENAKQADAQQAAAQTARINLLTERLQSVAPRAIVIAPDGTRTTAVPPQGSADPLDPSALEAAASDGKVRK